MATDSIVSVVLSRGPERYAVPDVVGQPLDSARASLAEASLGVGIITEDWDPAVPVGSVVSSDPPVGEELRSGTLIDLVVSKGPKPVRLANYAGSPADEVTAELQAAGLVVTSTEEFSSEYSEGLVISTTPGKASISLSTSLG